jgi:hypothetical protein
MEPPQLALSSLPARRALGASAPPCLRQLHRAHARVDKFFAACAVGSDIYIFGARKISFSNTFLTYFTEENTWSTFTPMPLECAAAGHSVSVLGGLVYIVGAGDSSEVLRFDPVSGV